MVADPDRAPLPTLTKIRARGANAIGRFGLVATGFTILYHASDLGQTLPYITFTNLYHRGLGTHTDSDL